MKNTAQVAKENVRTRKFNEMQLTQVPQKKYHNRAKRIRQSKRNGKNQQGKTRQNVSCYTCDS